jgi:hypothetical protein
MNRRFMIWILEIFKLCYGVKIKFNKTVKGIKIPDCTGGAICTKTYHGKLNYKQTLTCHCKLLLMVDANSLRCVCWHFRQTVNAFSLPQQAWM